MKTQTLVLVGIAFASVALLGVARGQPNTREPTPDVVAFDMDAKFTAMHLQDPNTADNFCKYLGAKKSVFFLAAGYHRSDQPGQGGFTTNKLGCAF